eukprot:546848_1
MLINNSTILMMQVISIMLLLRWMYMLSLMINEADIKFSINFNYNLINKYFNENPHGIQINEPFIGLFKCKTHTNYHYFIYNIYAFMNLVHISTNKNCVNYFDIHQNVTAKIGSIEKFDNTNITINRNQHTTKRKTVFIVLWDQKHLVHHNYINHFVFMLIYLVHISGNTKNINYEKKLQKFNSHKLQKNILQKRYNYKMQLYSNLSSNIALLSLTHCLYKVFHFLPEHVSQSIVFILVMKPPAGNIVCISGFLSGIFSFTGDPRIILPYARLQRSGSNGN